jgi:hypothetical protein
MHACIANAKRDPALGPSGKNRRVAVRFAQKRLTEWYGGQAGMVPAKTNLRRVYPSLL